MKFVAIPAGALQAIDPAVLNPKENTIDEVILKNYEAHKDGSPQTVLNVSEAVADRLRELQPKAVSTETVAPVVPVVQPVVAPVVSPVVAPVPVVETVASVTATNPGPMVEPGPTESDSQTASSSDVLDPPSGEAKTEEKPKTAKK
jgi:hypothetical protein